MSVNQNNHKEQIGKNISRNCVITETGYCHAININSECHTRETNKISQSSL